MFTIIPDNSCDLTADIRKRFSIEDYIKGVLYYPDGHDELASIDWENMTPDEYFNSMKSKKSLYKTASPPVGEITEVFEKHLKKGEDILSISISSALSSTYNETTMVAKNLMKKYPERKILCVDSLRYSTAIGLLVILAAQMRDKGASLEETFEYLENTKHTIHQMGTMDDLFFLCKTGRLSNFKAFFGTLVGVNAMADFNRKGLSEVIMKVKGKKTAFSTIIDYMEKTILNPEEQIIFVAHSIRDSYAQKLSDLIKEKFSPKEVIIKSVGVSCGASIGPGICAAFYQGKPISEALTEEKAIMAQIETEFKNSKK